MATSFLLYLWFTFGYLIQLTHPQTSGFLVDPVSVNAVDSSEVEFSCTADNLDNIVYYVNKTSAMLSNVDMNAFSQKKLETVGRNVWQRNMTVRVSSSYNNTEIFCRAYRPESSNFDSKSAFLIVQGPLHLVIDLDYSYIDSSKINISWSPPFTLPGTAIIGYNISVTSNESTIYYFTSENSYELELNDITSSPCEGINITVSGYNGRNGSINSISGVYLQSVPPSDVPIPIHSFANSDLLLMIIVNVKHLCIGERPSKVDVCLFNDDLLVKKVDQIKLLRDAGNDIIIVDKVLLVQEDTEYTVIVSFQNLDGVFNITSESNFTSYDAQLLHSECKECELPITTTIVSHPEDGTDTSTLSILISPSASSMYSDVLSISMDSYFCRSSDSDLKMFLYGFLAGLSLSFIVLILSTTYISYKRRKFIDKGLTRNNLDNATIIAHSNPAYINNTNSRVYETVQ